MNPIPVCSYPHSPLIICSNAGITRVGVISGINWPWRVPPHPILCRHLSWNSTRQSSTIACPWQRCGWYKQRWFFRSGDKLSQLVWRFLCGKLTLHWGWEAAWAGGQLIPGRVATTFGSSPSFLYLLQQHKNLHDKEATVRSCLTWAMSEGNWFSHVHVARCKEWAEMLCLREEGNRSEQVWFSALKDSWACLYHFLFYLHLYCSAWSVAPTFTLLCKLSEECPMCTFG